MKLPCPLPGCPGTMTVNQTTRQGPYRCICKDEIVTVCRVVSISGYFVPGLRLATDEERGEYLARPLPGEA